MLSQAYGKSVFVPSSCVVRRMPYNRGSPVCMSAFTIILFFLYVAFHIVSAVCRVSAVDHHNLCRVAEELDADGCAVVCDGTKICPMNPCGLHVEVPGGATPPLFIDWPNFYDEGCDAWVPIATTGHSEHVLLSAPGTELNTLWGLAVVRRYSNMSWVWNLIDPEFYHDVSTPVVVTAETELMCITHHSRAVVPGWITVWMTGVSLPHLTVVIKEAVTVPEDHVAQHRCELRRGRNGEAQVWMSGQMRYRESIEVSHSVWDCPSETTLALLRVCAATLALALCPW